MSRYDWKGPTLVVVDLEAAGLVAAADCRSGRTLDSAVAPINTGDMASGQLAPMRQL